MNIKDSNLEFSKNPSKPLIFYRRHLYWFFGFLTIGCAAQMLLEMRMNISQIELFLKSVINLDFKFAFLELPNLSGIGIILFFLFISLYQFIKPMLVLDVESIKTRGIFDPFFRVRLWNDVFKIEIHDSGDAEKSALVIYNEIYTYRKYRISPDELKRAIEFIATKLPPEKLILERKSH